MNDRLFVSFLSENLSHCVRVTETSSPQCGHLFPLRPFCSSYIATVAPQHVSPTHAPAALSLFVYALTFKCKYNYCFTIICSRFTRQLSLNCAFLYSDHPAVHAQVQAARARSCARAFSGRVTDRITPDWRRVLLLLSRDPVHNSNSLPKPTGKGAPISFSRNTRWSVFLILIPRRVQQKLFNSKPHSDISA